MKKQRKQQAQRKQTSYSRMLPLTVAFLCMLAVTIVLLAHQNSAGVEDGHISTVGGWRAQESVEGLKKEIRSTTLTFSIQTEYKQINDEESFLSLPSNLSASSLTTSSPPAAHVRWTTVTSAGQTCVAACHDLSRDETTTNNATVNSALEHSVVLMCDEVSLNSISDADAVISAAHAANRNCVGDPQPIYFDKRKNKNSGVFKIAPHLNQDSKMCFFAVHDSDHDNLLKCASKNEAGRERLCPCKTRESVFESIAKIRQLYSSGDYHAALNRTLQLKPYEYCYAPEEINRNTERYSCTSNHNIDNSRTALDKVLCEINSLYNEEGRLLDAYTLLESLPIEHNISLNSIASHNKWVSSIPLTVEHLLGYTGDDENIDKDIYGAAESEFGKRSDDYDDDNDNDAFVTNAVEYGKSRIQSTFMCKHYVYNNVQFHDDDSPQEDLTLGSGGISLSTIENRWANETFELPVMRDWYSKKTLDCPDFTGISLFVFEAEENSISEEWHELQEANRQASGANHYLIAQNASSAGRRMDRLSFLLGAELLDDKGGHISIHTPSNISEGIDFYISKLTVTIPSGEEVDHDDLRIPLLFNHYHTPKKEPFFTMYYNWGGQLDENTQILATLSADVTSFIDELIADNHDKAVIEEKISISHITIEAVQNFGAQNVGGQSEGRILCTFDLAMCSPSPQSHDDNTTVNNISVGVAMYLYNLDDPFMKSDQTRLWWQKRLYIFIEYYRIVHNITRIYIYGETDAYKELLKDYITAGIVQYIDWPYMFDLGDGDIRAGIERARNMLGKPVPGRSDKFLNVCLLFCFDYAIAV